ncbi:MAG: hypothetical protein JWM36_2616 [Hyphomicrobiales bacterium]|nr:hypothetical protein [Hyphomicrobiales bacterium]
MRKRIISKANIHKSDYLRALVSDTLPGDIPIIVSNDGFYKNLKRDTLGDPHRQEFIEKVMSPLRPYTAPYRFNVLRGGAGTRRLSLTHPSAQYAVARFYETFSNLICYYCRKSPASIRSPEKVGSLFFVRGPASEKNKLKGAGIDTTDIETSVSNPASFFSYRGYDRAYKFFSSTDYMRLEKRYTVMHFADVAKCFSSIYTHTLFWAVADVQTAKDNTKSNSFSNQFDRLMQSMNFNETNGICVGAEVSRVFAELILSEVDLRIVEKMGNHNLQHRVHYEFKRYVDDYYLFAENEHAGSRLLAAVSLALSEFNLHLNEQKTVEVKRPFITKKTRLVRSSNDSLSEFFERFIGFAQHPDGSFSFPKRIRRSAPLLRSLLDSIKSTCFDLDSGYEGASNYVIGALSSRVTALVEDFQKGVTIKEASTEEYVAAIMLLLEAIYFFYNVNPTVASSLRVAQAAIQSANFIKKEIPHRSAYLGEQIVRWTFQFIKSLSGTTAHSDADCVPLEALNILLVLGEVGREDALAKKAISDFCGSVKNLQYFEIVSFLFCMRDDPEFATLRNDLVLRSRSLISSGLGVRVDAQAAHLALDLLACPYIDVKVRGELFAELRAGVQLGKISKVASEEAAKAFEADPWFVNWREADLLRMIRKKELSEVY